jgi:protein TonB
MLVSALLHLLLAWAVLRLVIDVVPPPRVISVIVIHPPPPLPIPKVPPKPAAASAPPVAKPIPHAPPGPVTRARPQARARPAQVLPAPPSHFGTAGAQSGLGLDLTAPGGGGGNGNGSIGDYDDAVKQRIQAAKTYPPGIPYEWNECVVEYQVTVDRTGQLLTYKLYGCGDPFLDSAARAAILMAAPFPVPPDFGGSQYTIFGSLVFKHSEDQQ